MADNYEQTREKLLSILKGTVNPPVRGPRGGVLSGGDLVAASGKKRQYRKKGGIEHYKDVTPASSGGDLVAASGKKHRKKRGGIEAGMAAGGDLVAASGKKHHLKHAGMSAGMAAGANPWVSHVKKYAADHGLTYGNALKEAGKHYKK